MPSATTKIPNNKTVQSPQRKTYEVPTTSLNKIGLEKETKINRIVRNPDANAEFTQTDLTKYWKEYAESLTIEKIHLKNTMLSCNPILKAESVFEIAVFNPKQKDEIISNKSGILQYLFDKLNNSRIDISVRIEDKENTEMIYTAQEKWAYLKKLNPDIEKLKATFNLSPE